MNERKAAHVASALLLLAGHTMAKLKLTQLLYIAERKSLELRGFPMIYDTPVCMPHGPALSATLNITNYQSASDVWRSCIRRPDDEHEICLLRGINRAGLRSLSPRDWEIIEAVWDEFGGMSASQLRNHTHTFPEYKDPGGSSSQLAYEDILRALGYRKKEANELANEIMYVKHEEHADR